MKALRTLVLCTLALAILAAPCLAEQMPLSPYEQAKAHQFLRGRLADTEESLGQCVAHADAAGLKAEADLKKANDDLQWLRENYVPKPVPSEGGPK